MRTVSHPKPVTCGADKSKSGMALSVAVEGPEYESIADFIATGCGGSEERGLAWLNGHAKTDQKNDVRAFLRDAERNEGEGDEAFKARILPEARKLAKEWDATVTRKVGTGQKAKSDALESLAAEAKSLSAEELKARVLAMSEKFGL